MRRIDNNIIFLIVGRSGSGKSTIVNKLCDKYGYKTVESYTTRPQRFEGEGGHIFITKEEFDMLKDKCAYTLFDGNEYCATSAQVDEANFYIIDPAGVEYFKEHYKGEKTPCVVFFKIDAGTALIRMTDRGDELDKIVSRTSNDNEKFKQYENGQAAIDIIIDLDEYNDVDETAEHVHQEIKRATWRELEMNRELTKLLGLLDDVIEKQQRNKGNDKEV